MLVIVYKGKRREVRLIPEPTHIGRSYLRLQDNRPDRDMARLQRALLTTKQNA
jgi:hypothetical protein